MKQSMTDVAYEVMNDYENGVPFIELWNTVSAKLGLSVSQKEDNIAQFYTDLSMDGRFLNLPQNVWDLRSRHTYSESVLDTDSIAIDEDSDDEDMEFLRFSVQQKKFCIKQREISVIESEGRVVYIYHGDEKYRAYQRLNTIEQKLNMKYFLRCNQSYIINVEQVDGVIDYDFHMKNGMVIPIRKRDKKDIVQKYYQKKSELND